MESRKESLVSPKFYVTHFVKMWSLYMFAGGGGGGGGGGTGAGAGDISECLTSSAS